jgi:Uma2 family endonuclease
MAMRSIMPQQPAVDERLVMPESGFEVVGGVVFAVSPAHEPHGSRHSKLSALLEAYVAPGFNAATDMLTRTSRIDDFAPDGSVYPVARDPVTGGRQLEQLAFEVTSAESLAHAGRKAAELVRRGVRRVFAIDVERQRGLEWSARTGGWEILGPDAVIDDPALVIPLPVHDLVAAAHSDDAVARALLAKDNPVLVANIARERADAARSAASRARLEATARAVVAVLEARGFAPTDAQRRTIASTDDLATLERWLVAAVTCVDVDGLLAEG